MYESSKLRIGMFDLWRWVNLLQERGVSTERCFLGTWVWVFLGGLSLILLFLFTCLYAFTCSGLARLVSIDVCGMKSIC